MRIIDAPSFVKLNALVSSVCNSLNFSLCSPHDLIINVTDHVKTNRERERERERKKEGKSGIFRRIFLMYLRVFEVYLIQTVESRKLQGRCCIEN